MSKINTVTFKQVRAFVAVVRSRSFAEAAAQIHLSQPALSIAIKNLEEAVGGQLLTRTTRTFALTPEGESFYPTAQHLLNQWENALQDLNNRFALRTGHITIASMPSFASNLLPAALKQFKNQHPEVKVALHDVIAEEVVTLVRTGQAEIGVSFDPGEHDDLLFTPLFNDHFMAVLPKDHPLAVHNTIELTQLMPYDLITLQAPSQVRQLISHMMARENLAFNPALETHHLVTIGRMVANDLGVSIVPALCKQQMSEVGVVCRPLKGAVLSRHVGIITRRRYPLSAAAQAMETVLINSYLQETGTQNP
jgi:LysR family carnitine catabolism transcriptional activator